MSNNPSQARIEVSFADPGGTFTDACVVGSNGDFVASKAYETAEGIWLQI
ncbi:MAG: hydantoin utilization protein A [Deltaproteobacteria bacterium]